MNFAVMYANRGFFPGEVIKDARDEMKKAIKESGNGFIEIEESKTRYGAVETIAEGKIFAEFLKENEGRFDGIIVCLPNFGDENGAYYALKDADVPILIQAYPDEIGKMDFSHRRDAVCGKIAMCNVLRQANIRYTLTEKFAVSPLSEDFKEDLRIFAGVCRTVKGFRSFTVGEIGARTTAFKTVRVDEIAMQKNRINIETIDMSQLFALMDSADARELKQKTEYIKTLADFSMWSDEKAENLARLELALESLIKEYSLDTIAIRCWNELQLKYKIAPCVILGDLNEKGICAACETDINNAVMMRALMLASGAPVMLFDVNNNYGTDKNKTILFHCGPSPRNMLEGKLEIKEHLMFKKSYGEGTGVGLRVGKVRAQDVTVGSIKTENGALWSFSSDGKITDDKIEKEFFGCGAVFECDNLSSDGLLNFMAKNGYRHHVAIAQGKWSKSVNEAFENYLDIKNIAL